MKSFVILQRAFVSLLCDSPRVLESSRWSRSDTHRLAYIHKDVHTYAQARARGQVHTLSFFFFGGWHRSPWLVTYTEMMMPFLFCLSCTFLLVGNTAVKSCLAVTRLVACLQTFQNENISQQNPEFFPHIVRLARSSWNASQNRCVRLILFCYCTDLVRTGPTKAEHNVKVFMAEIKHVGVPFIDLLNSY